ncbi:MAG TPA: vWA domain-containing protein, partial [Polyangiaceae bacterium]
MRFYLAPARERVRVRLVALCSTLTLVLAGARPAAAGQDMARINSDGTVDFNVHFAYPPPSGEVDRIQSVIRSASEIFCDATDGQLRFGKVTLTAGGGEATADVWILPDGLWDRSSSSGFLLEADARVFLTKKGQTNYTLAHELGHQILRLPDAYDEQSRFGTFYGIGYVMDPGFCSVTGDRCATDLDCGAAETCDDSDLTPERNTLMGSSGFGDPSCSVSGDRCKNGDIDCASGEECLVSALYSEFSSDGYYDLVQGDDSSCPGIKPGSAIWVMGTLGEDADVETFAYDSPEEAEDTSGGSTTLRYLDSLGVVTGYERDSSHDISMYAEHRNSTNREWTLHFLIDGKHLDGEDEGLLLLESIDIDFNAGTTSDPRDGGLAYAVRVCRPDCIAPGDTDYEDPIITIPDFENGAPGTELPLFFGPDLSLLLKANEDEEDADLDRSRIVAWDGGPQSGDCAASVAATESEDDDDFCDICENTWNTVTSRFESASFSFDAYYGEDTYSSEWDKIAALPSIYDAEDSAEAFNASIQAPADLPNGDPSSNTGAPFVDCTAVGDQVEIDTQVTGNDAILLLIDRSKSMDEDEDAAGTTKTRLEWAIGAARALSEIVGTNNTSSPDLQSLGLVAFSSDAEKVFSPATLDATGSATVADFQEALDDLSPKGNTGVATGLELAADVLEGVSGARNPAVMLLTDGAANVCLDGDFCGTEDATDEAVAKVEELGDDGITIYFTPIGGVLGQGVFAEAVPEAGGEIFPAATGREMPVDFARAYLRHSGIQPIVDGEAWSLAPFIPSPTAPQLPGSQYDLEFTLEEGASRLEILLSSRNDDVDTWDLTFELTSPKGVVYTPASSNVKVRVDAYGNFYKFVSVRLPRGTEGAWQLKLKAVNTYWQEGYAMIWTRTPADCYVGTPQPVVRSTAEGVTISMQASWETPIENVTYAARVRRPDGSTFSVPMRLERDGERATGVFKKFAGRGIYQVFGTCESAGQRFFYGEDPGGNEYTAPVAAPDFYRETSTSFVVDIPGPPPLSSPDCDGDGLGNASEGSGCTFALFPGYPCPPLP